MSAQNNQDRPTHTMGMGFSTNSTRASDGNTNPYGESDERGDVDFMPHQAEQQNDQLEQFENESQHSKVPNFCLNREATVTEY